MSNPAEVKAGMPQEQKELKTSVSTEGLMSYEDESCDSDEDLESSVSADIQ